MRRAWRVAASAGLLPVMALAQTAAPSVPATPAAPAASSPDVTVLPNVNVVGSAPLLGSGVERDKVPATTHVLTGQDIARDGFPSALRSLDQAVGGVALDDAAGNPFQPNLLYRGFAASPLEGNAQGLAVYVNGARFNQPFGDTVNWDLIPDNAIDRLNLEGANPVFGLNALGGSVSVRLKNGFTYHGGELELYGGAFGRGSGAFQYGKQAGNTSAYISGDIVHDGGWRQGSSSDLHRLYGDIGWRGDKAEIHLGLIGALNDLNNPGPVPVELLAADRAAEFTGPNQVHNKYLQLNLSGSYDVSDTLSVQGLLYYTNLSQRVVNGNTPNFQPCDDGAGFLCAQDGVTPLTGRAGSRIADFLDGGPYSQLNLEGVDTNGYGASAQVTNTAKVFGLSNQFVAGISFDGGLTTFTASTLAGGLTFDRNFIGPGITIDQSDLSIAPVRLDATNAYYGAYVSDVLDLTSRLSATLSGRFNVAELDLKDRNGVALNGNHGYTRFNPGIGLTYKITPGISAYAGYSEANRAPTPAELSCADPASPCTLSNFFVADPALKQVVARTIEAGFRGNFTPFAGASAQWNAGVFRTDNDDDILFLPSQIPGRDFFQNVGSTRRQGVEAGLRLRAGRLLAYADYAWLDASFLTGFAEDSPLNPGADANGQIQVRPGDRLPGVPQHRLKFGASYGVTEAWTVGFSGIASSGQFLFGDEANLTPRTRPYVVLNLNTSYQVTKGVQLFGLVQNVLDAKYETFGAFSPVGEVPIAQVPGASNPRSLSPAAPVAGYAGVRFTF